MQEATCPNASTHQISGIHESRDFLLMGGDTLRSARLAWYRYGPPPAQARAVVLLLHGISGSHQALSPQFGETFPDAGWASAWIGPGAVLDTRHTCVLVPNALGSCFGSTSPTDRQTTDFPPITISDTVRLQAHWLAELGVSHVDTIIGYSYGGYQAFEWAVSRPLSVGKVVVLASAPHGNGTNDDVLKLRALATDITAGKVSAQDAWVEMRCATLRRYGYADWLRDAHVDNAEQRLRSEARTWAQRFSPWSLAALRHAACTFDVRISLLSSNTPIYWMRCISDDLFPPNPCTDAQTVYPSHIKEITINGKYGHLSPLLEYHLWEPSLRGVLGSARCSTHATCSARNRPSA